MKNNEKSCSTCAWYCHADGKCYGNREGIGMKTYIPAKDCCCGAWSFDGLEDWERVEYEINEMMTEVL